MNYFRCGGSEKVTIDGEKVMDKMELYSNMPKGIQLSEAPYTFVGIDTQVVIYNDEIHILGGRTAAQYRYHYKWDGTTWTQLSDLPYNFSRGVAVVYHDEIHIFGSVINENKRKHYKWDGTTWTQLSDFPSEYGVARASAVVYNNEIHILSGYAIYSNNSSDTSSSHYKWDGTTWTQLSDLPWSIGDCSAVVYDGCINVYGNSAHSYKWDGTTWTQLSDIPYNVYINYGVAIEYMGKINIFGDESSSNKTRQSVIETPLYVSIPSAILGIYV